jgi:membrane-bound lytic murein transglycosylase D
VQLGFSQSQDSTLVEKKEVKETKVDTLIDDKSTIVQTLKAASDTIPKKLEDLKFASDLDEKWLSELYSSSLYDTIYKSVSELKYEEVYYPELPTDTLKKRLAELDAKTPFNIEYNPSLESVIKGYLKNRRKSFEKLMALSEYYFPMFERELDNHNIPLEIKYLAIVESA